MKYSAVVTLKACLSSTSRRCRDRSVPHRLNAMIANTDPVAIQHSVSPTLADRARNTNAIFLVIADRSETKRLC